MSQRKSLLAYIREDNEQNTPVLIDIIEVSKSGTAYHYQGMVYQRHPHSGMVNYKCENDRGDVLYIEPLSRQFTPEFLQTAKVTISDQAKNRYDDWSNNASTRNQ